MEQEKGNALYCVFLKGTPLSDGKAAGQLWHVHGGQTSLLPHHSTIPDSMIAGEVGKMRQAFQVLSLVMENSIYQVMKRLGESYAAIFVAFREILHDPMLLKTIQEKIENQRLDAGSSITTTLESFRKRLSEAKTPLFKERADDLLELQTSLLDALNCEGTSWEVSNLISPVNRANANTIAVVETLTPRLVLDLKNSNIGGIVCENAGPTSHAAILCRAFRVPAVAGIKRIHSQLPVGEFAVIDGERGTIECGDRRQEALVFTNTIKERRGIAARLDLADIVLMANLNLSQNAISAMAAGAQGIGLYRTEFEFILDNRLLSKQEQFNRYRAVVVAMMGLPVTIRLLDISVDKTASVFDSFGSQSDPSCCGALFLMSRPEILSAQARAIAKASMFGPVRVVYPMVANAKQFLQLKRAFYSAAGEDLSGRIKHGAMIELPSAVEDSVAMYKEADFACLGTNDLIKQLLHVNRDATIAHDEEIVNAPKLWEAIGRVASAASTLGKELTVCGEMASNTDVLPRFIGLGIKSFSMDISKLRDLRKENYCPV